jgi:predicted Zn-dependent peptidase
MSNVAEFIEARLQIESLVQEIVLTTEREAIPKSKQRLEEAAQLLETLKGMADNYVQENAVGRLAGELSCLGAKVEKLARKKPASKKKLIA